MHLLPQVSSENLNEGNLQRWDLAMHEDACQIQLHLETHVYIGTIDGGGPPQGETSVGNLVQTRPLCIRQLLVPAQTLRCSAEQNTQQLGCADTPDVVSTEEISCVLHACCQHCMSSCAQPNQLVQKQSNKHSPLKMLHLRYDIRQAQHRQHAMGDDILTVCKTHMYKDARLSRMHLA